MGGGKKKEIERDGNRGSEINIEGRRVEFVREREIEGRREE